MRKITPILFAWLLYGCSCMAQIPTQYVYLDTACQARIPDYSYLVTVRDNCDNPILTQDPVAGTLVDQTTIITMRAVDSYGNSHQVTFNVVVLDTIAPTIQLNENWTGYTDQEVGDMYRTFFGWVQLNESDWNRLYAGTTQYIPEFDLTIVNDSVKVWSNTIDIPSQMPAEWWWGVSYLN